MAFLCEIKSFEITVCSGHGSGKNSCSRLLTEIAQVWSEETAFKEFSRYTPALVAVNLKNCIASLITYSLSMKLQNVFCYHSSM